MHHKDTMRVLDMTRGKTITLLLQFSLPLFLGNLLQQLYNLADTSIAGNLLGDAALAQIGATAALYGLITNAAFGLNNGLGLTVSRSFGAGDQRRMRQGVCWMVELSLLSALVLTSSFLLLRKSIVSALQIPADTVDGALQYLTVILSGIPFTMLYNLESALLQAVGNSVMPLLFLLFSSLLNVGLDLLFMGPLAMGVWGAAIATILSQGVSALLGGVYILKNYPELRFSKEDHAAGRKHAPAMLWAGISMALMSAIYNIGSVVLQGSINALGNVYIAAQVGGRRLAEFFYMPGGSVATAMATFASQNYGAGKRSRIAEGVRTAILLYGIWWLAALAFTFLAAPAAVRAITGSDSDAVIQNAVQYLKISIPMIPPMAVLVILRSTLQGMRHTVAPLLCSSLELIGKVIFAFWIVPARGYMAVCVCEPVTWVVCCVFILAAVFLCRNDFRNVKEGEGV